MALGSNRNDQHTPKDGTKKGPRAQDLPADPAVLLKITTYSTEKTVLLHSAIAIAARFGIIVPGRASSPVGRAAFKAVELLSKWLVGFDSCLFRHTLCSTP